jgi:hypothetical protein
VTGAKVVQVGTSVQVAPATQRFLTCALTIGNGEVDSSILSGSTIFSNKISLSARRSIFLTTAESSTISAPEEKSLEGFLSSAIWSHRDAGIAAHSLPCHLGLKN